MGWVVMPTNRVPTAEVLCTTGSVSTTYPLANLQDPTYWNYCNITGTLHQVLLTIDLHMTPHDTSGDKEYAIGGLFIGNHNLDGTTITLKYGTTNVYGAAAAVSGFPMALTATCKNPNMLYVFPTHLSYRYWFLNIDTTVIAGDSAYIGVIGLGPVFDLGYPERPEGFRMEPLATFTPTQGGYQTPGRLMEPSLRKSVIFKDPTQLGKTYVYNRNRSATYTCEEYNTLIRHFSQLYQVDSSIAAETRTGLSAAGGAIPVAYHEGSLNGLSTAGRPAFYGYWRSPQFARNARRQSSELRVEIEDCLPHQTDLAPSV